MLKRMSLAALLVAMAAPALAADASYRDVARNAPTVQTSSTGASQTAPAPKHDCDGCGHRS